MGLGFKIGMTKQEALEIMSQKKVGKANNLGDKISNTMTSGSLNAISLWFSMDKNGVIDNEKELQELENLLNPVDSAADSANNVSEKVSEKTGSGFLGGVAACGTWLGKMVYNSCRLGAYTVGGLFVKK